MAAMKKDSTFSVDVSLKYFILGAFSSSLFLFGSSILYGVSGTTNFEDLKNLFFAIPLKFENAHAAGNYTFIGHVFLPVSFFPILLLFQLSFLVLPIEYITTGVFSTCELSLSSYLPVVGE